MAVQTKKRGFSWLFGEFLLLAISVLLGIGAFFVGFWLMNHSYGNPHFNFMQFAFGILLVIVGVSFAIFMTVNFLITFAEHSSG
jgi:hypothetical protein